MLGSAAMQKQTVTVRKTIQMRKRMKTKMMMTIMTMMMKTCSATAGSAGA
jgi:hypothetical protein